MTYQEFLQCTSLSKEQILGISCGTLIKDMPEEFAYLPAPPFLMIDRITKIERNGSKGKIVAEMDVRPDNLFFQVHFRNDPVHPGCLGVDAIWQLLGLYCSLNGGQGAGRALGCKEVEFLGQVRPFNKVVRYEISVRRFTNMPQQGNALAVGNGKVFVDDEHIYTVSEAKAGVFKGLAYTDFPNRSKNSVGGAISGS
ncbi:MAG: bifunctional 3-hydroxydecanoyl-ACP dehydratase/trans-2-decenoyl-ACP isomerase [Spirochaetia bacterium]|nr:bifunctional 3-hydroxydecanoyl-ACP dehydratase/trans-2-decenoyl-ACP isomerase [Spirochaetia bacterium]